MTEKYLGQAPRELRAAAVARHLATGLTFENSNANVSRWVKAAAGSEGLNK